MGYQHGRVCHATFAEWADDYYSSLAAAYLPGVTTYEAVPKKSSGGVWEICRSSIDSVGTRTSMGCTAGPVVAGDLAVCDPAEYVVDGALVGFLVGACYLAAWAVLLIRREMR